MPSDVDPRAGRRHPTHPRLDAAPPRRHPGARRRNRAILVDCSDPAIVSRSDAPALARRSSHGNSRGTGPATVLDSRMLQRACTASHSTGRADVATIRPRTANVSRERSPWQDRVPSSWQRWLTLGCVADWTRVWALAASVPLETQAGVSVWTETSRRGNGSLQHVGSAHRVAAGRILQGVPRRPRPRRRFATAWRRDTTRGRWAASCPARPTWRRGEPRSVAGDSWAASSRATRCWARPCATTTSPCGAWPRMRSGPSGSAPIRPSTIRSSSRCGIAISREQLEQAETLVTRLIADAPDFAEAYNQRAIIYFHQGRFAESVQDCQRVLARNPYHFGAISGMAKCQLRLNRPRDALKSLRRALKLQPHNDCAPREHPRARDADRVRTGRGDDDLGTAADDPRDARES